MSSSDRRGPLRKWIWLGLVIPLLAVVAGWWRWPDSQLAALRAQGHPVTPDDLERALGPEAERGRSNVLRVLAAAGDLRLDRKQNIPQRSAPDTLEDRAWAEAVLGGKNDEVFQRLHARFQEGPWCLAQYSKQPFGAATFLIGVKDLTSALAEESVAAAILGDSARAGTALTAAARVGPMVEGGGVLIDFLVGMACELVAIGSAEPVFTLIPLSDSQYATLQQTFREAEGTNVLAGVLIRERALGLETFRMSPAQMAASGLAVNSLVTPTAPVPAEENMSVQLYWVLFRGADQRFYLDQMERLISAARQEGPGRIQGVAAVEERFTRDRLAWGHRVARGQFVTFVSAVAIDTRRLNLLRSAQTACAVERFRLKHQRLPERIEVLVPEFLNSVPLDAVSGQPLKYRIRDKGYVVYGVGDDGEDNGGTEKPRGSPPANASWDHTFVVDR